MSNPRSGSIGELMSTENRLKGPKSKAYYDSVLELIGNTPLVKLNKIPKENKLGCNIFAKCEFLNPGGSVKDRVAYAMYQDAVNKGHITDNTHLVEPSSGNTGIGIAMMAALNGKKCTIVTADKNSDEKVSTLHLLGADVVQTKDSIELEVAHIFKDKDPNVIMLNQFENSVNPWVHHQTTAREIIKSLDRIDMVVMGVGSGGTITGVAGVIKEVFPKCLIVAAEPDGSTQIDRNLEYHSFLVEGIGGSQAAMVFDKSVVDYYTTVTDKESFLMAREMAMKEGLMCGYSSGATMAGAMNKHVDVMHINLLGGSSGTAMAVAIKAAKHYGFGEHHNIVVVLPDGIRNYMSKFISNQWMEAHLFRPVPNYKMKWWNDPAINLKHDEYPRVKKDSSCKQALDYMRAKNACLALITDDEDRYVGVVTKDFFRHRIVNPNTTPDECILHDFRFSDPVTDHLVKNAMTLDMSDESHTTVGLVSRTLDVTDFVVLGKKCSLYRDCFRASFVVTSDRVLEYIYGNMGDTFMTK